MLEAELVSLQDKVLKMQSDLMNKDRQTFSLQAQVDALTKEVSSTI